MRKVTSRLNFLQVKRHANPEDYSFGVWVEDKTKPTTSVTGLPRSKLGKRERKNDYECPRCDIKLM